MNVNDILAAIVFGGNGGGGGGSGDLPDPVTISHGGTGATTLSGAKRVLDIDDLEDAVALRNKMSNVADNFDVTEDYEAGKMVFVNGDLVRFKVDHSAGEIGENETETVMVAEEIKKLLDLIDDVYKCETMTMAQYEALTEAQKMDGTVRYITDADSYPDAGGVGF